MTVNEIPVVIDEDAPVGLVYLLDPIRVCPCPPRWAGHTGPIVVMHPKTAETVLPAWADRDDPM